MRHDASSKVSAYSKTQRTVVNPRQAEYLAFVEATRRLIASHEDDRADLKALIEAVHLNRALWETLAKDCADSANQLPAQTRASIISLARWVGAHSRAVMRDKESLAPLIDINRMMIAGLSGGAADSAGDGPVDASPQARSAS